MWKSRAGSVSIALIVLIAPLFVYHAALIDAARVKMGERQAEEATKAALRSVLSAYDPKLRDYGLFGVSMSEAEREALFSRVLAENLSAADGETIRLVEPLTVSESIRTVYTLGNHAVFGRQVLEEMKYRAPIEFTLGVTDKLTSGSGAAQLMTTMSKFTQHAYEIEQLMERRDELLDEAWQVAKPVAEKLGRLQSGYATKLGRMLELHQLIGLRNADDVRRSIATLQSQAASVRDAINSQQQGLAAMLQAGIPAVEAIIAIQQTISGMQQNLNQLNQQIGELETVLRHIAEYALLLETMKQEAAAEQQIIAAETQRIMELLDQAKALDEQIREKTGTATADAELESEALQAASLPDAYYIRYRTAAAGMAAMFSGFETAVRATTPFAGEYRFGAERLQALTEANNGYGLRAAQFLREQGAEEEARMAAAGNEARRKREERQRFGEIWAQAKLLWADCPADAEETYRRLAVDGPDTPSLYRQYADYNRTVPEGEAIPAEIAGADATLQQTKGMIDRLLDGIASLAGAFRDELYLNEYALTKFNYRTYGLEKDNNGEPKRDYESSGRERHALQRQEAEYLLYGLNSCTKNHAAAYGEMFALRLAVRTAEALLSPEAKLASVGSPLAMLLWALAEGAVKAFADMTKLVQGEEVKVAAKAPDMLTMGYKDYLRLFMLLHTKQASMSSRMQSLIELNTGQDLRQAAAYVQARTETSVALWFMPYTMRAFGYPTDGSWAIVHKTAFLSY